MPVERFLFDKISVLDFLRERRELLISAIAQYDSNQLLSAKDEDLLEYFSEQFLPVAPTLKIGEAETSTAEVSITVTNDIRRGLGGRSMNLPGQRITLSIPFTGHPDRFKLQPSSYTSTPPMGLVQGQTLQIRYEYLNDEADEAKTKKFFETQIEKVQQYLETLRRDFGGFVAELPLIVAQRAAARREQLRQATGLAESLGFPMQRRADDTVVVPVVQRAILPKPAPGSKSAYRPQPSISDEEYQNILRLIEKSMEVLERSPKAFSNMGEEYIRTQILVVLNAQYEGQATGETFNSQGKTDIFIRADDGNVFVAECKFWDGPKKLHETIDQLMKYVTWRDTKTAIVLFCRQKEFSKVLSAMKEAAKEHAAFLRETSASDARLDCQMKHPDDSSRIIQVAFMAFHVPS